MFELLHVIGECEISFPVYFAGSSKPQRVFTNCRGIRIKRLANWFHNWIIVFFALLPLYLAPPCIIAQIAPYSGKCQGRCIYSVTLLSFQITSLLVYFWIIHCTDIISWYVLDCSINCAWIGLCKTSTEGLLWVIKQEFLHCWRSDLLSTEGWRISCSNEQATRHLVQIFKNKAHILLLYCATSTQMAMVTTSAPVMGEVQIFHKETLTNPTDNIHNVGDFAAVITTAKKYRRQDKYCHIGKKIPNWKCRSCSCCPSLTLVTSIQLFINW